MQQYLYDILNALWQKLLEWKDFLYENLTWFVLKVLDFVINVITIVTRVFFNVLPDFDFPEGFDEATEVVFDLVPVINKVFPVTEFFMLVTAYLTVYLFVAVPFRRLSNFFPIFGGRGK
jgi:hypothetical protein